MHAKEELKTLRKRIETTDAEIIRLLGRRFTIAEKIGKAKNRLGLNILQPKRELEVVEKVKKAAKSLGVSEKLAEKLFVEIINASKGVQE